MRLDSRRVGRSFGKSTAQAMTLLSKAAELAGQAMNEFRIACYPEIPNADHPVIKQMQAVADMEGKKLVLVKYPRHISEDVFRVCFIQFDHYHELNFYVRRVVNWRGKKLVYQDAVRCS